MGTLTAMFLARRGARVSIFDQAPDPMTGASRWNEGKIHLGYLYSADPTLATALKVLPGGLSFAPLAEEAIGTSLADHTTPEDDHYIVHRDSIVDPESMGAYFERLTETLRENAGHGRYLGPLENARVHRLSAAELVDVANPDRALAGFAVPERSVDTGWFADRLSAALGAETGITRLLSHRVTGVARDRGLLFVETEAGREGPFRIVVNALWHGRPAVDRSLGIVTESDWSHRYRVSAFVRTTRCVSARSAVLAVGPFGDVKNYDGRNFYVSWYPAGLLAEGRDVAPPECRAPEGSEKDRVVAGIRENITREMPSVRAVFDAAEDIRIEGGYVFARGHGSLSDPTSTIHDRSTFGVTHCDGYVSVDTGKYSSAPIIAKTLAENLLF